MSAATSAPKPHVRGASCTITTRPVRRTLSITLSVSSGSSVRRSTTSTLQPRSLARSAASSDTGTMAPYAIRLTCSPARATRALPMGTVYERSGTSSRVAR